MRGDIEDSIKPARTTHRHSLVGETPPPPLSPMPFRGSSRLQHDEGISPLRLDDDDHGHKARSTPSNAALARTIMRRIFLRFHRLPKAVKLGMLGVVVLASFLTPYFISEGLRQDNLRWQKRTKVPLQDEAETLESLSAKYVAKERAQQVHDWEAERRFQLEMEARQRPPDCSQARALVVKFSKFDNGLAAMLQWLIGAFTYAAVHGRTLVVASPDDWMWAPGCGGKTFECYFHPVSSCGEADVWPSRTEVLLTSLTESDRVVYMNPHQYDWNYPDYTLNEIRACRHFIPYAWCRYWYMVPDHFRDRGVLWWKAQIAKYLFKPLPRVEKAIQETKQAVSWEDTYGPRICVHVRRGDKIKGSIAEASEISLENYAARIADVAQTFGARSVFVATDDPNAMPSLRPLLPPGLRVLYDAGEERADGAGLKIRQGILRDEAVQREIVTAAKNIALLSQCDAFIGTFTSWFSKFSYELKYARGSVHAVSLDRPLWYWQP